MRTTIKLLIVLALALATFIPFTSARAGDVFKFKGKGADAFFSMQDATGCVFTDVFVFASDEFLHNPPGRGSPFSGMVTFLSIYDACTDTLLLAADGFTTLADSAFQVSGMLESATLTAVVNVFDFVSNTSFDVSFDLDWVGDGPLFRNHGTFHFNAPGCKVNSHFNARGRPAVAAGSVTANGMSFTAGTSLGASILSARSGDVVIGCN